MDLREFAKRYWWIGLLILYFVAAYLRYEAEGLTGFISVAGVTLVAAIFALVMNNSAYFKKIFRKIKYFIGYNSFNWDTSATFLVRGNYKLADQISSIETIIKSVLSANGIKIKSKDQIEISKDSMGGIKVFVSPYSLYLSIDSTDADMTDNDQFSLTNMVIRARTSLRYKQTKKIVSGFIVDLFRAFDDKYGPIEQKYSMKIVLEGMSKNFFKEQFIKEFRPDEIQNFSIIVKNPRSYQEVTHSHLTITTDRREELVESVSTLILRMT